MTGRDEFDERVRQLQTERARNVRERPRAEDRAVSEQIRELVGALHALFKTPADAAGHGATGQCMAGLGREGHGVPWHGAARQGRETTEAPDDAGAPHTEGE